MAVAGNHHVNMERRRLSTSSRLPTNQQNLSEGADNFTYVPIEPVVQTRYRLDSLRAFEATFRSLLPSLFCSGAHSTFVIISCFVSISLLAYLLLPSLDLSCLFLRLLFVCFSLFGISSIFYWATLLFRNSWSTSSAYVLFCACFIGEIATRFNQVFENSAESSTITSSCVDDDGVLIIRPHYPTPSELTVFLLTIVTANSFNSLSHVANVLLICMVTLTRYLAYATLVEFPLTLRPYSAYFAGICGIIVAKYTETMFRSSIYTSTNQDGKLVAVRRRRTSATMHGNCSISGSTGIRGRRTSLPALSIQRAHHGNHLMQQGISSSVDVALLSEAHGLISDMLADNSSLPPHIISGLQALSNLLSPPNHVSPHQQRQRIVGGLVSLTDFSGSDTEENLPYTGERPSALPKKFKKNVPQSLLRRMSTSTWTTTTSATGMPTLEPEPCRKRSTSFRHPPDMSPTTGMSCSLSLPASINNTPGHGGTQPDGNVSSKCRSFSTTTSPLISQLVTGARKGHVKERERKTVCSLHPILFPEDQKSKSVPRRASDDNEQVSEMRDPIIIIGRAHAQDSRSMSLPDPSDISGHDSLPIPQVKGVNTSDYDSCDSPSGSETFETSLPSSELGERSRTIVASDRHTKSSSSSEPTEPFSSSTEVVNRIPTLSVSQETSEKHSQEEKSTSLNTECDLDNYSSHPLLDRMSEWDFPIFELQDVGPDHVLSQMCHRVFIEVGLFETFKIPLNEFLNYFRTLECGYQEKPYHNSMHAADVLHAVYYLSSQAIPGFIQIPPDFTESYSSDDQENSSPGLQQRQCFTVDESYGVMGANVPALELMALYTASAMHDYDHPGRTNAFLVTTNAPLAVLYNDRSVLENHHAAAAWNLLLSNPSYNFLKHLEKAEFKRFRFLVVEAILATDLKRHFEILAEFNAKVNDHDAPGIDWQSEADRMLVMQMCIKLADINGPCKRMDLHVQWTGRIAEEFYEQGDEEAAIGLTVSPFMDRKNPQLAKLQESFINHLVAPLCNAYGASGLLPGQWVDSADSDDDEAERKSESESKDTEDEGSLSDMSSDAPIQRHLNKIPAKKITCLPAKHIQDNYDYWIKILKEESKSKDSKPSPSSSRSPSPTDDVLSDTSSSTLPASRKGSDEMETIHEEELTALSNHIQLNSDNAL
ncbi:PDE3B (predicted) [Pycnogonum litorale]